MSADSHPDSELRKWSVDHNRMINRIIRLSDKGVATPHELENTNKQISNDMEDSAENLSTVCRSHARKMQFLSQQEELSAFLHNEFSDYSDRLESTANRIEKYGKVLAELDYFHFK